MGERGLGRQPSCDQMRGCRGLRHPVGAGPTGVFRPHSDDDPQLGRHDVQALRSIFADLVHDTAAAGADQAVRLDDFLDTRQCGRQVADGALRRGPGCTVAPFGGMGFFLGLDLGQRDGQVLEGQLPLVLGQLFRPFAMQRMVQFSDQVLLPPGDFRQRSHRFHQRLHRRALRNRDGGQIKGGDGLHGLMLSLNPSKNTQNQPVGSLCRSRRARVQRLHLAPVQPGKQRLELGMVQRDQPIFDGRPGEAAPLQSLVGHHQTSAVPIQKLETVRAARAEDRAMVRHWFEHHGEGPCR